MNSFHSYSKIYNLGHKAVADLLTVPCILEEKVDGSQFSFGVDEEGTFHCRSKGAVMIPEAPEKMFALGVKAMLELKDSLHPGWTYRGEYLAKPKHNVLAYDRVPKSHVIIFDINDGEESFLCYGDMREECERLGLEYVPLLLAGDTITLDQFRALLDTPSVLGGQKIEGVVVKPAKYNLYGIDKKVLMGKFVSEAYKEIHSGEWKAENPSGRDVIGQLGSAYCTPARWQKAVQHLQEGGYLEGSPKDIGALMREVPNDVLAECMDEIKEKLWVYAWPHIRRQLTHGLPEWYKEELLKKQFDADATGVPA